MRALVQGSAERLAAVMQAAVAPQPSLPGRQLRILDGNHLPASEKRLKPLRGHRGAALPGHTLVVYDPDLALVVDLLACEDAHQNEQKGALQLVAAAKPQQLWVGERNFCTGALLRGWQEAGASFLVREHASSHPRVLREHPWQKAGKCESGTLQQQIIEVEGAPPWRRIRLTLDQPTESGDTHITLWTNLSEEVTAAQVAQLYRKRWRIEGMFGRLESVLDSELRALGHPRAALLGFATAILAYNVLALLQRCIEEAQREYVPELEVSTYHLAVHVASDYQGMLIALPPKTWDSWAQAAPEYVARYLLTLARRVPARSVATSKRGPKKVKPTGYVDAAIVRQHVSTARVLAKQKKTP
jgi:IS4 transposase